MTLDGEEEGIGVFGVEGVGLLLVFEDTVTGFAI
jgi:hypothetical protein